MNCYYIIYIIIFIIIYLYISNYEYLDNYCKINTCKDGYILSNNKCILKNNIYNFSTCGATGRLGPTLEQCNNIYKNTNVVITMDTTYQGIQKWIVPKTGTYEITVAGAGINHPTGNGKGVIISSSFTLNAGDLLRILVGQKGYYNKNFDSDINKTTNSYYSYSGSGGTFVVKYDNTKTTEIDKNIPLIIAGGGGGCNVITTNVLDNSNASYNTSGQTSSYWKIPGGINGNGGEISNYEPSYTTGIMGAPGGFLTNGKATCSFYDTIISKTSYRYSETCGYNFGYSFLNGGMGGKYEDIYNYNAEGGFGGGSSSSQNMSGAGGGYSGGGAGVQNSDTEGGGGGSYSSTTMTQIGYNNTDGYVKIEQLS